MQIYHILTFCSAERVVDLGDTSILWYSLEECTVDDV